MIVSTPDGQVQFPDDMSNDDIKGVLQKKYGAPQTTATATSPQVELQPRSLSQVGSDVANFGRAAANTLGIGDSLLASQKAVRADIGSGWNYLTGRNDFTGAKNPGQGNANDIISNLAAEKAKTTQAREAMDPSANFIANMIGGAPVGGMAGKTLGTALAPYTGKWLGGVLGAGGESALVSGGAAAGRGDPILPAMAIGGAGGAALGLPGGVVGRGTLPATPSAADFERQATSKYGFADQIKFGDNQIKPLVNNIQKSIDNLQPREIREGQGALAELYKMQQESKNNNEITAASLNDYVKKMQKWNSGDAIPTVGQTAQGQINGFLKNAAPVTPHAPGVASQVISDANALHGRSEDLNRIQGWETAAAQGGTDVAKAATGWLNSAEGKRIAPPGSPQNAAYQMIGEQAAKGGYIPWWVKHYMLGAGASALIGEGTAYLVGDENSPWTRAAEEMATGLTLGAAMHGWNRGTVATNTAAQQRNIDAAKATIGSGRVFQPMKAPSPTGDALRYLYSRMTPGALPGTTPNY